MVIGVQNYLNAGVRTVRVKILDVQKKYVRISKK